MIFAAGLGTRLKPLTDSVPKALVKVYDRPLLEWIILRLKYFGYHDIIINTHHHAQKIVDFLKVNASFGLNIDISYENTLLDTGGGLKKAAWFFEDTDDFLVHNVDILSDIDLHRIRESHRQSAADATLAIRKRITNRYLLFDNNLKLCGWRSKKENETLWVNEAAVGAMEYSFSGIHIISTRLLKQLKNDDIFSIIPEYLRLAANNKILGFCTDDYKWMDLGRKESLKKMEEIFTKTYFNALQKNRNGR